MGALSMLARAELRARWRALVALGVLIGIIGAAALAASAGARRTATAHRRLSRAAQIGDIGLLTFAPGLTDRIAGLPSVESAWIARFAVGKPEGRGTAFFGISAVRRRGTNLFTPIVSQGRMFGDDRMEEIVVSERLARQAGIRVGDLLPMKLLTAEEFGLFDVGFGEPDGPRVDFRVTGLVRLPGAEETFAVIYGSPALAAFVADGLSAGESSLYRLRRGVAGVEEFRAGAREIATGLAPQSGVEEFEPFEVFDTGGGGEPVAAAARVLMWGLLAFVAVALLVGGFMVVQAISRYSLRAADEHQIESALGMTRRERIAARAIPSLVPAIIGALLSIAGAVAASPATPIGSIAQYEPTPGLDVNVALLGAGGTLVFLLVPAAFVLAGRRALPRAVATETKPSAVAERVAAMGLPAPTVVGLRFSLERGRGRTAVPVRSAMTGAALGVAGLIAVAAFASSLDRLVATPERWGWQGHLQIIDLKPEEETRLLADERVTGFARITSAQAGLPGDETAEASGFRALRGSLAWTMHEGRMPQSPDEVAVGPRFAERLGLSVGEHVTLLHAQTGAELRKTLVGIGLGPSITSAPFADGAVLTAEALADVARSQPFTEGFVRLADGVDVEAFTEEFPDSEIEIRQPPADVANLGGLGRMPDVLGGVLALVAAAAVANSLVVGVRRRRRDLAVLRALGFVGRQAARAVRVSAAATIVVGLVIGIPAGLIIGNVAWRAVASYAYVAGDPALPGAILALIVPAAFAVALVVSAVPARRAARMKPAEVLQTE